MESQSNVTGWQELFSHTNTSNFRRPLQSLTWDVWRKIYRLPNFEYALLAPATKIVQKRTAIVFAESSSRDQSHAIGLLWDSTPCTAFACVEKINV